MSSTKVRICPAGSRVYCRVRSKYGGTRIQKGMIVSVEYDPRHDPREARIGILWDEPWCGRPLFNTARGWNSFIYGIGERCSDDALD